LGGFLRKLLIEFYDIHDFAFDNLASLHLMLVIDGSVRAGQGECGQAYARHNNYDSYSEEFRHSTHELSSFLQCFYFSSTNYIGLGMETGEITSLETYAPLLALNNEARDTPSTGRAKYTIGS
jgi:hypothetical protein